MSIRTMYKIVGIAILATTTLGFGASLSTPTTLDRIGNNDNVAVSAADTYVTKVTWTESASDITSITVEINNTDTITHTYEICVITKAGASISDTTGTSVDCTSTGSIASKVIGSAAINFAIPLNASLVDGSDISIEQTS